ncbi:efflux RND transporter periplasmic adaptor subunit [Magnetovibrio sp. PR-2]|uniref:efflux RND transporter periplasmic adaptor subunit n=1 Tax=Magnetovibrio sp. PR-2 TaxID=3120356 RepID=UPI002FCE283F
MTDELKQKAANLTGAVTKSSQVFGMTVQPAQKTAAFIAIGALLWMLSGIFVNEDAQSQDAQPQIETETPTPRVRVTTIVGEEHVRTIAVLGRTEAKNAVSVRAETIGRVVEIVAEKGAMVEAGEVLVKLDPENLPAKLAEAKARLSQRKIAYESARKLSKGGYSSQLNLAEAKANLEAARAEVKGMQRDLDNTTIMAPFAGVVDELPLDAGDYIDKVGGVVARVIDLSAMLAAGEVAERDIGGISLGGEAYIVLPDGREFDATVSFVAKASSAATRTYKVEVRFDVVDGSVPEGMTAELHLPMERIKAHNITPALLTLDDEGDIGVKVVMADGTVEFFRVEMISDTKDGIWLTGLPHEAKVISVGQEFVIPGQTVIAVEGTLETARDLENGEDQGQEN